MLLKPLVLQHLRKKKGCGWETVRGRTPVSQPQQHFFVNVVRPMVLATFWSPEHRFGYKPYEISTILSSRSKAEMFQL